MSPTIQSIPQGVTFDSNDPVVDLQRQVARLQQARAEGLEAARALRMENLAKKAEEGKKAAATIKQLGLPSDSSPPASLKHPPSEPNKDTKRSRPAL